MSRRSKRSRKNFPKAERERRREIQTCRIHYRNRRRPISDNGRSLRCQQYDGGHDSRAGGYSHARESATRVRKLLSAERSENGRSDSRWSYSCLSLGNDSLCHGVVSAAIPYVSLLELGCVQLFPPRTYHAQYGRSLSLTTMAAGKRQTTCHLLPRNVRPSVRSPTRSAAHSRWLHSLNASREAANSFTTLLLDNVNRVKSNATFENRRWDIYSIFL